jgi:hypothetical protein
VVASADRQPQSLGVVALAPRFVMSCWPRSLTLISRLPSSISRRRGSPPFFFRIETRRDSREEWCAVLEGTDACSALLDYLLYLLMCSGHCILASSDPVCVTGAFDAAPALRSAAGTPC